jgi:hypothetical protein
MKIHLNSTANLGDFVNAIPVLSGIEKSYGKLDFIIRGEMRKFKGIKEFLMYQDIFSSVEFDDDVFLYGDNILQLSSWTREDKNTAYRPTETCRYENWIKDHYKIEFEVDDSFTLNVPELSMTIKSGHYSGDRWSGNGIDSRRNSNILSTLDNVNFLDYNNTLLENAYLIKYCESPFISTFTGIAVIADLLNKPQIVLWGDDLFNWDNKPIQLTFEKHFYTNRNSKLVYIDDFNIENLNEYH